jgi:iron-sulfur cluster assembly accessory protein
MSYTMDFIRSPEELRPDDLIMSFADGGVELRVDPKSLLYLFGLTLDYSDELIGGGYKFFNPNASSSCGCGTSFNV